MLFAAGSVQFESWLARPRLAWIKPVWCTLMVLMGVLLMPTLLPVLPPETYIRYVKATHLEQPRIENHKLGPLPQLIAEVDVAKLHQLVLNLVRNACEAVASGGHIDVSVRLDDERCVIGVRDDGPGIPDHVKPRIYEPFFSTKEGGTGLGMSIVHSLVSLHGGTIDLETGSRGTAFEVRIPRWR